MANTTLLHMKSPVQAVSPSVSPARGGGAAKGQLQSGQWDTIVEYSYQDSSAATVCQK